MNINYCDRTISEDIDDSYFYMDENSHIGDDVKLYGESLTLKGAKEKENESII